MPTFVVGKGLRDITYGDVKFTRGNRSEKVKEVNGGGGGGAGGRGRGGGWFKRINLRGRAPDSANHLRHGS